MVWTLQFRMDSLGLGGEGVQTWSRKTIFIDQQHGTGRLNIFNPIFKSIIFKIFVIFVHKRKSCQNHVKIKLKIFLNIIENIFEKICQTVSIKKPHCDKIKTVRINLSIPRKEACLQSFWPQFGIKDGMNSPKLWFENYDKIILRTSNKRTFLQLQFNLVLQQKRKKANI